MEELKKKLKETFSTGDYPNIGAISKLSQKEEFSGFNFMQLQGAIKQLKADDERAKNKEQEEELSRLGASFDEAVSKLYCATTPAKGTHLFNNKGPGYGPDKVLAQGAFSGPKGHPSPNWQRKLAEQISSCGDFATAAVTYKQSPAGFTDNLPMLSTGPEFNATIGSGPAWAFAIPMPNLQEVDPANAERVLNTHAADLNRPASFFSGKMAPGKGWVLKSSDGTLNGNFVCFHKEDEETAFVSDAFPLAGVCFRATHAPDDSHQGKWKMLKDYPVYAALCKQYNKAP